MRLLELKGHSEFSLSTFIEDSIPPYAILSHTWGADGEEVTFKDLVDCTSKSKTGYAKIQFCGEQAAGDGLQYFWVDTCCIDKSSSAELTEAINSMFRWYRKAAKCYVYLSDVSIRDYDKNNHFSQFTWESPFRESRWFTRGWTLQELIAPASVEFFSLEGKRLGDRKSLERQVHEITGIAIQALQGNPLSDFSVTERMSWAAKRKTTRKEDLAYCLLGIFDIHMPLIYGEGEKAFIRLKEEIDKSSKDRPDTPSIPSPTLLMGNADKWSYEITSVIAAVILALVFGDKIIKDTPKLLICFSTLGLLSFTATKAHRCTYGGASILGMLLIPCAAFLDWALVWVMASFFFREFILDERIMLEGMRDLHPAGGDPSKRRKLWEYDGPHGSGDVQLFRLVERPKGKAWVPQEFVAPATAWVYYLDELRDGATMNTETCVIQLYRSMWTYNVGACGAVCSMGFGLWIAWMSANSVSARFAGMCLAVLRTLAVLARWTADLLMSNHHRGISLKQKTLSGVAMTSCKDYRLSCGLNAFPKTEFLQSSSCQTAGRQMKTAANAASRRAARLFQSRWLDWCADHFEVRNPTESPNAELDVRVGNKSHIITAPDYVADGLCNGTGEHRGLTWLGVIVTISYAGLVVAQFVLFVSKGISGLSVSLWGAATAAGILATAYLGGFPLVCSGIT